MANPSRGYDKCYVLSEENRIFALIYYSLNVELVHSVYSIFILLSLLKKAFEDFLPFQMLM